MVPLAVRLWCHSTQDTHSCRLTTMLSYHSLHQQNTSLTVIYSSVRGILLSSLDNKKMEGNHRKKYAPTCGSTPLYFDLLIFSQSSVTGNPVSLSVNLPSTSGAPIISERNLLNSSKFIHGEDKFKF